MPSAYELARDRLEAGRARRTRPDGTRAQRYFSLRLYFLALIATFIAVAGAAAAFVHIQTGRDARAESFQAASFAAHGAARQLGEDFASLEKNIGGLAATPGIEKVFANPAGCSLSFGSSRGRPLDLGHVDIIRADGTPMCSSRLPPESERIGLYRTAQWLKAARERQHLAAPVLDPASGHQVAVVAAPIAGGVVAGFLDLTALGGQLAARYGGDRAVVMAATGDRRTVLAHSIEPKRWIGTSLDGTPFTSTPGTAERQDLNGKDRLYSEARVTGVNWVLAVGKDKAAALGAQSRLEKRQFAIIGFGLLLLLAATSMIRRRVALPIAQLGRELRAGSDGGLPHSVTVPTACPEELRSLAVDVNLLVS
ncbi:MAG: hypothetical protein QOJ43_2252, partial [Gaiellaceae bacterium]|nr:hypothetical protein [Gaiellaceae bacterium]